MLQPIVALLVIKCDPDFNDMGNEWYRTRSSTFRYTSYDRFITLCCMQPVTIRNECYRAALLCDPVRFELLRGDV